MGWGSPAQTGTMAPGADGGFEPLVADASSVLLNDCEGWYQSSPLVMGTT